MCYINVILCNMILSPVKPLKFSTLPSDDSCSNRAGVVLNSHTPPPEQVFMST